MSKDGDNSQTLDLMEPQNDLDSAASELVKRFNETLHNASDGSSVLAETEHCAFVKSADGQILFTNKVFESLFGQGVSAVGRYAHAFLDEVIVAASARSDELIVGGCSTVQFDHPGRDCNGRNVRLRTVKKSLLGLGHPRAAILGLTQVLQESTDDLALKVLGLARRWQMFQQLDERDRKIAVLLANGAKTRTLSGQFKVTEKTIDNRRAHILKRLELKNTMELARLLCRLQDNGFADFGL